MATITCIEELEVWQVARNISKLIYPITLRECYQRDRRICDQVRGSVGSIMDNIAEGFERSGNKEFIHFLSIAKGEAGELKSQIYRSSDIGYLTQDEFVYLLEQIQILINKITGLINYLNSVQIKGAKFKIR